jgi:hypothetical protein
MAAPQAGPPMDDHAAYRRKMEGLLGNRDPLDVFTKTADALETLLRSHPAEHFRRRPYPGKWTPGEILGHLADVEWVLGFRLRLVLCEDRPTLVGMNQELWVAGQGHAERDPASLVGEFRMLRTINLGLWRRLRSADLDRIGLHTERGPESVGHTLRMYAGHDLSHLDQLNRYLKAAAEGARGS